MTQRPLDYGSSLGNSERRKSRRVVGIAVGVAAGFAVTLPALFLAVMSAGAGHGDYAFARGLFPVPMCIAVYLTDSIGVSSLVLACLQFPLYGATIGYFAATSRKALVIAVSSIAFGHLVAFAACSGSSAFS